MAIVEEKELLEVIRVGKRKLRYFRDRGLIPFIKTGRLSCLYDLDEVLAALKKHEHKAAREKLTRKPTKVKQEP